MICGFLTSRGVAPISDSRVHRAGISKYDIDEEVAEESDEHMFFFSWTDDVFEDPAGDGNIDNRNDDVNYSDEDSKGLPLGLTTTWRTSAIASCTKLPTLSLGRGPVTARSGEASAAESVQFRSGAARHICPTEGGQRPAPAAAASILAIAGQSGI